MTKGINLLDPPLLAGAFVLCLVFGPLALPLGGVGLAQAVRARHAWGVAAFGLAIVWGLFTLWMLFFGQSLVTVESG